MKHLDIFIILGVLLLIYSFTLAAGFTEKENEYIKVVQQQRQIVSALNLIINKLTYFYIQKAIYPNPIHHEDYTKLTSPYGKRVNPLQEAMGGPNETDHKAVDETGRQILKEDIEGTWMARVITVADGKVDLHYLPEGWHNGKYYAGYDDSDGYITIKHFDGKESRYLHLGETYVHENQIVKAGNIIGRISEKTDGKSTGPHLHFELLDEDGNYLQPLKYIEH